VHCIYIQYNIRKQTQSTYTQPEGKTQ